MQQVLSLTTAGFNECIQTMLPIFPYNNAKCTFFSTGLNRKKLIFQLFLADRNEFEKHTNPKKSYHLCKHSKY